MIRYFPLHTGQWLIFNKDLYILCLTIGALTECFWMIRLSFIPASVIQNNYLIGIMFIVRIFSNVKISMVSPELHRVGLTVRDSQIYPESLA